MDDDDDALYGGSSSKDYEPGADLDLPEPPKARDIDDEPEEGEDSDDDIEFVLEGPKGGAAAPGRALPTTIARPNQYIKGLPIGLGKADAALQPIAAAPTGALSAGLKPSVDLDAVGQFEGKDIYDVDIDTLEDKPWRKPGADISDYFNFGFNEQTWRLYVQKQKRLRDEMSGSVSLPPSALNRNPVYDLPAQPIPTFQSNQPPPTANLPYAPARPMQSFALPGYPGASPYQVPQQQQRQLPIPTLSSSTNNNPVPGGQWSGMPPSGAPLFVRPPGAQPQLKRGREAEEGAPGMTYNSQSQQPYRPIPPQMQQQWRPPGAPGLTGPPGTSGPPFYPPRPPGMPGMPPQMPQYPQQQRLQQHEMSPDREFDNKRPRR
ncbi:hypothetical protein SeMB42_g02546 [Synchytrium endobioticum]|uniref:Pre-mRNA polyadenylation factor Fip1 domain-containing protein n=1 Tax=Synchytrium endobioticum TaxID=286115 RepID=A0A507DFI1_9FUNG|nr:hypothetical protein SeMB42_g02546 [Synchytrium endobioticum]TPX51499.1 hypothetical protein SeLEV6574_g00249 [Synchytrium endobioticum]